MSENWGPGDKNKWRFFGEVLIGKSLYKLFFGEHPHSRIDDRIYAIADGSNEAYGFNGHRFNYEVTVKTYNYLKQSELSGSEIRKGGEGIIKADGEQIYEFFTRDIEGGLQHASNIISKLSDSPSNWVIKEERDKLVGKKIYYREYPAIIESLIVDQGCLIIVPAYGSFPTPVYALENEDSINPDNKDRVKVEVISPHIWWFRNKLFEGK